MATCPHSVRTGQSAFLHIDSVTFYDYLDANPEAMRSGCHAGLSRLEAEAIVNAY
jgi:hypothetical protein